MTITTDNILCYDLGPEQYDRYTVVYPAETDRGKKYWPYVGMSDFPSHPLGVGMHGELVDEPGDYLGTPISFADLPEECKGVVLRDIEDLNINLSILNVIS